MHQQNVKEGSSSGLPVSQTSNQPANKICHFKKIHLALLGQIFEEAFTLDRLRAELVSKRFEKAAKRYGWTTKNARKISWEMVIQSRREMETIDKETVTNNKIIALIRRARPFLCELDLESFKTSYLKHDRVKQSNNHDVNGVLCAFFKLAPNIAVLKLNDVDLKPAHLDLIAKQLAQKLKEVRLENSFLRYINKSPKRVFFSVLSLEDAFRRFFIACKKLEVLSLVEKEFGGACFDSLPITLRFLKINMDKIYNNSVISIGNRCVNHLETFIIFSDYFEICKSLNETLPKLTKLKTLYLCINGEGISPSCFVASLQNLKVKTINDDCLRSICDVCQSIQSLNLEACHSLTAESFESLAKLPKLVHLNLFKVLNFSDDALKAIAQRGILKSLDLSSHYMRITGDSIHALVNGCKSLKSITPPPDFTNDLLWRFFKLPKLAELFCCYNISDRGLKAIVNKGVLRILSVRFCKKITDDLIINAVAKCKSLINLDVGDCSLISNRSLDALNAEMERRFGAGTEPMSRWDMEKRRFRFFCSNTQISELDVKSANKWIFIYRGRGNN